MAVEVALHHETEYQYGHRIKLGPQIIRLRPAPHTKGVINSYNLDISPEQHFINWQQDPFGNFLARVVFPEPSDHFKIVVGLVAEIRSFNPFDFFLDDNVETFPFEYDENLAMQLKPYLQIINDDKLLKSFVQDIDRASQGTVDFLVAVNQMIYRKISYLVRLEPGVQSSEETLSKGSGSCRDFAWLLCQVLRHLGLASRFVSGYLIQLKQDVKSVDGANGPEEDFTDLHAWTEVYLPGAGWVGLDATSGLLAGEGHIPLCCTPFPQDAAPVTGEIEPCESQLKHNMSLCRLENTRRVTKPFLPDEWDAITKLGEKVDKGLLKHDVRLTMGGEPTFVPADNIESESWVGEALGCEKWKRALGLLLRLRQKQYPGSLVHLGQGKWYPGETLPRWAISAHYRLDGEPILASESSTPKLTQNNQSTLEDAQTYINLLANLLGIPDKFIINGTEPDGDVSCYVLPLLYSHRLERWISSSWDAFSKKMTLLDGDSAVGYRLPLHLVPVNQDGQDEIWPARDPQAAVEPFKKVPEYLAKIKKSTSTPLPDVVTANGYVRTALCVELRKGKLFVFCPPINYAEHYLELIAALNHVASELSVPINLEGYRPPYDRRLQVFSVTPDPGVIEVNITPVSNWTDYQSTHKNLYEEAHKEKLSSSRFFIDGRRVGTGGGNHIVLGAAKVEDSPFLRRPDLLRSMLTFWQHHPSLSYLFSSEFIGPTSQAPRVDEARFDSLYELEIAFQRIEQDDEVPPWLVDRLFRNLLIDASGNTHRTEFCIDKLYAPGSATGRLGLLEMRGFEMPPHPQMALVQGLLVRAAILAFWKKPYCHNFVRWGSKLHDEFMLPDRIWADFKDVLSFFSKQKLDFDPLWFQAFLDFRCPLWGKVQIRHMELELRHALEPWHVMGEDLYQGGVSRAVDSSVERLQVRVKGYDSRYRLTCNGYQVPLRKIEDSNDYIAGVRYKAWQPPSGLHPTLPVNTPLKFDLIEVSSGYSHGGCTFYAAHPGGRSYETVPINENEAESRCRAKFSTLGHTVGKVPIKNVNVAGDFPCTLDLRTIPILHD